MFPHLRRPASRLPRAMRRAGLLVSMASVSASAVAQPARTGWEGVTPTGWPNQKTATAAAEPTVTPAATSGGRARPTRTAKASVDRRAADRRNAAHSEVAVATVVRARGSSSRAARRRARAAAGRQPSAPVWITLEWETPPPIDVALEWTRPLLSGLPVRFVLSLPETPLMLAPSTFGADLPDPTLVAESPGEIGEARLPVATMIQGAAVTPESPRPRRVAGGEAAPARVSGFRAFVGRMAGVLGLRRAAPESAAPRVARAEGAVTR
jgi:hypothetical protein